MNRVNSDEINRLAKKYEPKITRFLRDMTRFGMNVVLAHPEGYEAMPEVEAEAKKNAETSGGSYRRVDSMAEAFEGADIVYPKSWAPFTAMEGRTRLYEKGDWDGIDVLEKELIGQNARHKDWTCTEELMAKTKDGAVLYMHCLPADISGVSCEEGEVAASVFDRYRVALYKEASQRPYIIAAMIFLAQVENVPGKLTERARCTNDMRCNDKLVFLRGRGMNRHTLETARVHG